MSDKYHYDSIIWLRCFICVSVGILVRQLQTGCNKASKIAFLALEIIICGTLLCRSGSADLRQGV